MHTPRISVIIALYNAEDFIETCLDSILQQTFKDFEVILVDDCSTDGSFELVREKYCVESGEKFDPRIKLFHNMRDLHASFAVGIALSSESKYIYMMDHDDALLPNCLETFYNAIEKSGADAVHMNANYDAADPNFKTNKHLKVEEAADFNAEPRFLDENLFQRVVQEDTGRLSHAYWRKIMRRELYFNGTLPIPSKPVFPGDSYWFMQEICLVKKIQVIDACQYIRRQHPASVMHQASENKIRLFLNTLPAGIELVDEIFESEHLISDVTDEEKLTIKMIFFTDILTTFVFKPAFRLSKTEFHDVLLDVFSKTTLRDPKISTLFLELLTAYLANAQAAKK